jgi:hypothetical protein
MPLITIALTVTTPLSVTGCVRRDEGVPDKF